MKRFQPAALVLMALALSIGWSTPDPTELLIPANMSVKDGRLFVSDTASGVHVYDVTDAAAPSHLYTIALRGNEGNAVVGDVLFANDSQSLRAFHLGDESYVQVASFERQYSDRAWFEGVAPQSNGYGCGCSDDPVDYSPSTTSSTGSSYATFAVAGEYLYALDRGSMVVISVADPLKPAEVGRVSIGWDVETVFPAGGYLFMGGNRGMYIYTLDTPTAPREVGRLIHARACDPVVVEGDIAYVTLRGAGRCGPVEDALLAVDISDPAKPELVCETGVQTPFGLSSRETLLYVSKGENGFVLFDVTVPETPEVVASWSDVTKDFIWMDDRLYSMTFDRVDIYDVADPAAPGLLSTLQ